MDLFARRIFKVPLYQLTSFLLVAIILVNETNCSDSYVSRTPQSGSTPVPRPPQQQPQQQQQYQGSAGGSMQMQSSGSGSPVENVHKMLSHAMSETINNEFGSE
jgi:hypothetical protein